MNIKSKIILETEGILKLISLLNYEQKVKLEGVIIGVDLLNIKKENIEKNNLLN